MAIDMVHRGYDSANTWGVSREEKGGMLKNLQMATDQYIVAISLVKYNTPSTYHATVPR
jgi:hypothetical protein